MNPQLEPFIKNALLRQAETIPSKRTLSSGFSDLDRVLPGGGWPIGALTEIMNSADEGIGELSLLMPAIAAASQSGQGVVLVNALVHHHGKFARSAVVDGTKFIVRCVFAGDFLAAGRQGHRIQSAASPAPGRAEWQNAGDIISLAPRWQSSFACRTAIARDGDGRRVGGARAQAARYSAGSCGLFDAASDCVEAAPSGVIAFGRTASAVDSRFRTTAIGCALENVGQVEPSLLLSLRGVLFTTKQSRIWPRVKIEIASFLAMTNQES